MLASELKLFAFTACLSNLYIFLLYQARGKLKQLHGVWFSCKERVSLIF